MLWILSIIFISTDAVTSPGCPGAIVIDRCYWLVRSSQSAAGTNNICNRNNGILAEIKSWQHVLLLDSTFNHTLSQFEDLWIGVQSLTEENEWVGFHHTPVPVTWTHWLPYEPKIGLYRNCTKMKTTGEDTFMWQTSPCSDMLPGICQRLIESTAIVDVTTFQSTEELSQHRIDIQNNNNLVFRVRKASPVEIYLHSSRNQWNETTDVKVTLGTIVSKIEGCRTCNEVSVPHTDLNFTYGFSKAFYECNCTYFMETTTTEGPSALSNTDNTTIIIESTTPDISSNTTISDNSVTTSPVAAYTSNTTIASLSHSNTSDNTTISWNNQNITSAPFSCCSENCTICDPISASTSNLACCAENCIDCANSSECVNCTVSTNGTSGNNGTMGFWISCVVPVVTNDSMVQATSSWINVTENNSWSTSTLSTASISNNNNTNETTTMFLTDTMNTTEVVDPNNTLSCSNSTVNASSTFLNCTGSNTTDDLIPNVCNCTNTSVSSVEEVFNSTEFITVWITWAQGLVQVGLGSVLGDFMFMEHNGSDTEVNFMTFSSSQRASWEIDIINGQWCTWSFWYIANSSINNNVTNEYTRTRSCDCPYPSNGGTSCSGLDYKTQAVSDVPNGTICPEPAPVANAYRILGDGSFGCWTTYACYDTFIHISGDLNRQCDADRNYTGQPPVCITECQEPPAFNGAYLFSLSGTSFGDRAFYRCEVGFEETDTSMSSRCGEYTWQESYTMCIEPGNLALMEDIKYVITPPRPVLSPFTPVNSVNISECICYSSDRAVTPQIELHFTNGTEWSVYDIYQISFTFPNTSEYLSMNLTIEVDDNYYRKLQNITQGKTYILKPNVRYGTKVGFTGVFNNTGTLSLCNIVIRGRKRHVNCARPHFSYPKQVSKKNVDHASYSCAPGFYNKGGDAESSCEQYRGWSENGLKCTDDPNHALFSSSKFDAVQILSDNNDETCTNASAVNHTFALDHVYEVSEIVVTVAANTTWEELEVLVTGEGKDSICTNSNIKYPTVRSFKCNQYPIGSSVVVRKPDASYINISICEIRIYGSEWTGHALECRRRSNANDYKGYLNISLSGKYCLHWNDCAVAGMDFPDTNSSDAANYCRNPVGNKPGPWCYVGSCEVSYCAIPYCDKICSDKDDGFDYIGQISKTISGKSCSHWRGIPSPQPFIGISFPRNDRNSQCRNPGRSNTKIWCYINGDTTEYEECYIPKCPIFTDMDEMIFWNRTSDFNVTKFRECFRWTTSHHPDSSNLDVSIEPSTIDSICGNSDAVTLFCQSLQTNTTWTYIYIDCYKPEEPTTTILTSTTILDTTSPATTLEEFITSPAATSEEPITSTETTLLEPTDPISTSSESVTSTEPTLLEPTDPISTPSESEPLNYSSSVSPVPFFSPTLVNKKQCPCKCLNINAIADLQAKIKLLQKLLLLDKSKLLKTRSKKSSASDDRISAQVLSIGSIIILLGFVGIFIFPDFISVINYIKKLICKYRFKHHSKNRPKTKTEVFELS